MKWYVFSGTLLLSAGLHAHPSAVGENFLTNDDLPSVAIDHDALTNDRISVDFDHDALNNDMGTVEINHETLDNDTTTEIKTIYERHNCNYRDFWYKLIPNQVTAQYAGSIGVASLGFGWHYGKHLNWETDLMLGIVPKYHAEQTKVTFTVKERYIPWHLDISSRWMVEPLTTGLFFNSIFGEGFWSKEPSKYPDRYYGFSTRIRANVFLGQRFTYRIPSKKRHFFRSISAYYEFSSCDMYIISAITNKNVKFGDILSFAAGLKFNIM